MRWSQGAWSEQMQLSPLQVVDESKILEVHVDPGAKDGQEIKFMGEGNQEPGVTAGNIVIVLDEQSEHSHFVRKGAHLIYDLRVTLREALCGTTRYIDTLDVKEGRRRVLKLDVLPGIDRLTCQHIHICRRGAQARRADGRARRGLPALQEPNREGQSDRQRRRRFPAGEVDRRGAGGAIELCIVITLLQVKELVKALPAKREPPMAEDGADHFDLAPYTPKPEPKSQHGRTFVHPILWVVSGVSLTISTHSAAVQCGWRATKTRTTRKTTRRGAAAAADSRSASNSEPPTNDRSTTAMFSVIHR